MQATHLMLSPNVMGALLMMASMACFTVNDTMIKATDGAVPLSQLIFLRGILSTAMIYLLVRRAGSLRVTLSRQDWALVILRTSAEVGAVYFFFNALLNMPLANTIAILQMLPLTLALGAALFFREKVGWRRMLAIAVGFVGMLFIVRPGTEGFNIWAIYALIAMFCVTARDLFTRKMSSEVPSMLVTLAAAGTVMVVFGFASLSVEWQPVAVREVWLIIGSSIFIAAGYYLSVRVMRVGEVSFTAPFRYTSLLFALILGWLVFGDWPDNLTLIGSGIIVATGLFTLWRERRG